MDRVTVHLHVGIPKTGSTSFQKFLYLNRKALAEKGFAVFCLKGEESAKANIIGDLVLPDRIRTTVGRKSKGDIVANTLNDILATSPSDIIISSEVLSFIDSFDQLKLISDIVGVEPKDIRVYWVDRAYDDWLKSWKFQLNMQGAKGTLSKNSYVCLDQDFRRIFEKAETIYASHCSKLVKVEYSERSATKNLMLAIAPRLDTGLTDYVTRHNVTKAPPVKVAFDHMGRKIFRALVRSVCSLGKFATLHLPYFYFKCWQKSGFTNQDYSPDLKFHVGGVYAFSRVLYAHKKEPQTQRWIKAIPEGSVFWDIGANVGIFSLLAASRGLHVVAWEPLFFNVKALVAHLDLNPPLKQRITILPIPLSGSSGSAVMNTPVIREGYSGAQFGEADSGSGNSYHTFGFRADDVVQYIQSPLSEPNYIKLDVDGLELEILQGMSNLLSLESVRGLSIEVENETQFIEIEKVLSEFSFRFVHAENVYDPEIEIEFQSVNEFPLNAIFSRGERV